MGTGDSLMPVEALLDAWRNFLQGPGVVIRVAEMGKLDAPLHIDFTHRNAPPCEELTRFVDVLHDQMQPLDRSWCSQPAHAGSDDDGTRRTVWRELDDAHSIPRLHIMVGMKTSLFGVKCFGTVNVRYWYQHDLKFHLYCF